MAINRNKVKGAKYGTKRNADSGVIYHSIDRMDYLGAINPAPIFLSAAQLFLRNPVVIFIRQLSYNYQTTLFDLN